VTAPPASPDNTFIGILELLPQGFGFVRARSLTLAATPEDVFVPASLVTRYHLRAGVDLVGVAGRGRGKSREATSLTTIGGLAPEQWTRVPDFSQLSVVSPSSVINLECESCGPSMRVVALFCPIGRGQRALIVSPPKAGKTMLLQQLAHAISEKNRDIDLEVLLVDERPEEVTDMRRTVRGDVYASSSDQDRATQVRLAQLVLEQARRKVELGKHVVMLLDSLTRLGRAFNAHQRSSGRTMSGGVDIRALEIPKRIFGAARTVENGGSLTIIATALVDTGSRMDELIFEEFKGTGNMELVLDRELADERIFPAINLRLSGTRREELLYGDALRPHQELRRSLARMSPREAMLSLQKLLAQYPTNALLLSKL
jgi:transcription termination factor Rho